ncbi:hypothetical protein CEXT_677601 [Caerostris extrusa]|uniref:Uncharacterized protein n=1 Tax=Caerostris extrusa TaxID=172846 RepID=A0AAV4NG79_CAEEX|nr:hypothetical protein CEXT_677601 [Caerostris extrusa]
MSMCLQIYWLPSLLPSSAEMRKWRLFKIQRRSRKARSFPLSVKTREPDISAAGKLAIASIGKPSFLFQQQCTRESRYKVNLLAFGQEAFQCVQELFKRQIVHLGCFRHPSLIQKKEVEEEAKSFPLSVKKGEPDSSRSLL